MTTMSPAAARPAPLSDEELVAEILAGHTHAFELLMRRHNQRLFRLARAVVANDAEAEEVVQEAYVRAYQNLPRFEHRSKVGTWLSRIAFHEALRRRRLGRRARPMPTAEFDRMPSPRDAFDASRAAERDDDRAAIARAMDSLPAAQRTIVMLRLVEGMSTRETAECLRMTEANVKVTLHRARLALRERLEEQAVAELRQEFAFAESRCDRLVAAVFNRLSLLHQSPES